MWSWPGCPEMLANLGAAPSAWTTRVPRWLLCRRAVYPLPLGTPAPIPCRSVPTASCSRCFCSLTETEKEWRVDNGMAAAVSSTDLVDKEYGVLKLKERLGHLGHVRIRQHVNPLSSSFSTPAPLPDWNEAFSDPTLPLMVDIGCGSGRFLIWLAKNRPEQRNYLGLEIRQKLVERAQFWVKDLQLENIHFVFANGTVSFDQLVTSYPGPLVLVSILCPDPHFKRRHWKRRVVAKPLVDSISRNLCPGGRVFLQSDVLQVAMDIRTQFDSLSDFFDHVDISDQSIPCDADGWVLNYPMGIRTEREIHAEFEGARVFRRVYKRRELPYSS